MAEGSDDESFWMGGGEPYSDDEDENIVENFVMVEKPTATSKLHLAPNSSGSDLNLLVLLVPKCNTKGRFSLFSASTELCAASVPAESSGDVPGGAAEPAASRKA